MATKDYTTVKQRNKEYKKEKKQETKQEAKQAAFSQTLGSNRLHNGLNRPDKETRQLNNLISSATDLITRQQNNGASTSPQTGLRYEEPLKVEHPAMTAAVIAAQPGTAVEKVLAPLMIKGAAQALAEGDVQAALTPVAVKGVSTVSKVAKPLTEAEKLGIPKSMRSNYKSTDALDGLQMQGFALPRKHLQGENAVKMFKEYGTAEIPENSQIIEQLRKYVPETRERYGLVGNTNITDEEIVGSLYKKALELGGDTAAVNELGEPLVLFRGDTKRYLVLKPRMSPEELATKKGTMDNSLGTLFLDFPNHYQGVDRYLGTIRNFNGDGEYLNSGTGSKVIGGAREFDPASGFPKGTYKLYSGLYGKRQTPISVGKLPGSQMESGINDLNGFVVRTKSVRDATPEISVLNDDWLAKGAVGSKPHMKTILIEDENGFPLFKHPDGSVTEALAGMDNRPGMAEHYRFVLDDAKSKEQGLLGSRSGAPLRDEHTYYNYYALPNFNIRGAKHLLPFDFRAPTQGNSRIIYRKQGGILKAQGGTAMVHPGLLGQLIGKKVFQLVGKRSNGAQTKSIPTIINDVLTGKDKSFYSDNTIDGGNEIDTYVGGKPYSTEFSGDASLGPDYTKYITKNYPDKNIKTYDTHFADTLYIDSSAKPLVEKHITNNETVGGSMGRYAHAPSYTITSKGGRPYDAGGHLMKFGKDQNGNIVAHMSDIYDFLPEDFEEKYNHTENPSWTRNVANAIGTPFVVRQNNVPVVFKEIVPNYKTDAQRKLGDFLSQGGDYYDLNVPFDLTDDQINSIFKYSDYGNDILDYMDSNGGLRTNNK